MCLLPPNETETSEESDPEEVVCRFVYFVSVASVI